MPVNEPVEPTARHAAPDAAQPETAGYSDPRFAPTHWGSALGVVEDLQMPSGQWCQVRRPGPQGLIEAGIIHSLDGLTGIVQNELIPAAEGKPKVDVEKIMKDPKILPEMMHTTDRIVAYVVLQPKVEMVPNDITRRKPGVIYTDMIDLMDKMFIMNYAMGGTRDLETFRQESEKAVGSLDFGSAAEGPA